MNAPPITRDLLTTARSTRLERLAAVSRLGLTPPHCALLRFAAADLTAPLAGGLAARLDQLLEPI